MIAKVATIWLCRRSGAQACQPEPRPAVAACAAQAVSTGPPLFCGPPLSPKGVTDELLKKPAPEGVKFETMDVTPLVQT